MESTIKLRGFGFKHDPASPASKFLKAFDSECTANPLNDRALVWKNQAVLVIRRSPSEPNDNVELADIRAMHKGGGAAAMQRLCELADQFRVTLYLYAKGYADVPTKKLVEYYKRFGFTDFGADLRYLDDVAKVSPDTWEEHEGIDMERKPQATPITEETSERTPAAIVHALRDQWVEEEGRTPREINSGNCFDFAGELESQNPGVFEEEGFGNFCNHDWRNGECSDDATGFDIPLMQSRGWYPPAGLTWNDMFSMFSFDGTHGWAYCQKNGLCYDIEAPDGVKNVFDLPFLQRWINSYMKRKRKSR